MASAIFYSHLYHFKLRNQSIFPMDEDPDDVIELGEPLAYVGDDGMQFTNSDDYYNMVAAMMALGYMPPADFVPDDMMGHPDLEIHLSDHSHSPVIVLSTPLPPIHENQLPSQQPSNDLVNKPDDKPKEKEKNKKSKVKEKKSAAKSTISELEIQMCRMINLSCLFLSYLHLSCYIY